jgi:biopolymer transport protein TolR
MSEWRTRRTRRFKAEMNVVPYIDVMLVLLIIFMVSAPLIAPSVINLPSVGLRANAPSTLPIEVLLRKEGEALELIDRNGNVSLGKMNLAQAVETIQARQGKADQPVVIAADKDVRYEAVAKLLGELQKRGVKRVGIAVL